MIKNTNSNNAIELIKAIYFHPKALKAFIDTTVKQLAISGKDISDENTKEKIKTVFLSNNFLKPFAEKFKTFFTDEETDLLLEIYQSDLMTKLLKHSEEVFSTLHAEMIKQVENIS
ncbi:MAG: hypothetical protein ACRCU0_03575 [Candidatus Rhabdochlamydia sp.]